MLKLNYILFACIISDRISENGSKSCIKFLFKYINARIIYVLWKYISRNNIMKCKLKYTELDFMYVYMMWKCSPKFSHITSIYIYIYSYIRMQGQTVY